MVLYMTAMLTLRFNHLSGGGNARFYDYSPPSYVPDDPDTRFLSVKTLCTVLEGQMHCHRGLRLSLTSPGAPLYNAHVTAGLRPKLSGLESYYHRTIEAIRSVRYAVRQALGNGAPPSTRALERPTTTPTRWFCHECKSGPYSIATQTGCTNVINGRQCDHRMCGYCNKE